MSDRPEYPYVDRNRSRHGSVRYYFRRPGVGRVRLPDPDNEPELFRRIHARCMKDPRAIQPRLRSRGKRKRHNPLYKAIWLAKARAKRKNWAFNLTSGWLLARLEEQNHRCAITGIEMVAFDAPGYSNSPYRPSIDRIDSTRGYTKDNCRVILLALNLALNRWGLETLSRIAERLVSGQQPATPPAGDAADTVPSCHTPKKPT